MKLLQNRTALIQIGIGLLIVVAIVLAIVLPNKTQNKETKELKKGTPTQAMVPIEEGEFVHQFEGINWEFKGTEEEGLGIPLTAVKFMFHNFSRHNGVYATFQNPYKLGIYQGECGEVGALEYDTKTETGIPIAFATCRWLDSRTDIAMFQEGDILSLKKRNVTIQTKGETEIVTPEPFVELYTIDLTTVVR